jgi:type II secretory pathway component PulK
MIRKAVHTVRKAFRPEYARSGDDQRGSMLLVALGILTLLSVMAVAFAMTMSLEKKATQNYVDGVKARLIAEGALERAIEEKRRDIVTKMYSDRVNEYALTDYWLPLEVTGDKIDPAKPKDPYRPSMVGNLGKSYDNGEDRYKIKVIDTQTQFNLNSTHRDELFVMMLRALGEGLSNHVAEYNAKITAAAAAKGLTDFQDLLFPIGNPFDRAEYPTLSPEEKANGVVAKTGVEAILALRNTKEGRRFKTKSELLECLARNDYRLIRDFVTTQSWFDPDAVDIKGMTVVSTFRNGAPVGIVEQAIKNPEIVNPEPTLRAPININLASLPVLYSAIAPVAGRRLFIYSGLVSEKLIDEGSGVQDRGNRQEPVYEGNTVLLTDGDANQDQLKAAYGTIKYMVYLPPLGYQDLGNNKIKLKKITFSLGKAIDLRRQTIPFKSFAEWDRFCEETAPTLDGFPSLDNKDHLPILLGYNGISLYRVKDSVASKFFGNTANNRVFREWYKRSYIGMLKSNFNPNGRFSQMNPDIAVYTEVDKGNLKFLASELSTTGTVGGGGTKPSLNDVDMQTNEWCFGSKGVFEIISLGEVMQQAPGKAVEIHAQEKLRSVLQIFSQLTHTTQRQFARYGHKGEGMAPGNEGKPGFPQVDGDDDTVARRNIATYPMPTRRYEAHAPSDPSKPASAPQASTSEIGGLRDRDMTYASSGYMSLRTHYAAHWGNGDPGDNDEFYDVVLANGMATRPTVVGGIPVTSLELRNDFYRREASTMTGIYGADEYRKTGSVEHGNKRSSLAIPAVAGGLYLAPGGGLRPKNEIFTTPVTNAFAIPLPPGYTNVLKSKLNPYWFTSLAVPKTFTDRWFYDMFHVDGYYVSDHRRRRYSRSDAASLYYLTYRATAAEAIPAGAAQGGETPEDFARRVRGTDKDWSGESNMRATKGVVSFWYKPDFDWLLPHASGNFSSVNPDRRYCGFFSATHVAEPEFPVAQPDPAQGTNGKTSGQLSRSLRGTQMFFTRHPDGSLRVTRLYFELAGNLRKGQGTDLNRELTRVRNPYFGMAARDTGATKQNSLQNSAEFLNLEDYKALHEEYYTIVNNSIRTGEVLLPTWQTPYFYPWPPQESFLPKDAAQYTATANRQEIDNQLNANTINAARYDTWAQLKGSADNAAKLDLKKGSWYLFTVSWDDRSSDCKIFVDGRELKTAVEIRDLVGQHQYDGYDWSLGDQAPQIKAPVVTPPADPAVSTKVDITNKATKVKRPNFCRLNVDIDANKDNALKDQLTIGGFQRRLAVQQFGAGVFKHTSTEGDVSLAANGTIDDFVVYTLDGTVPNIPTGPGAAKAITPVPQEHNERPRFFTEGKWTQRFSEFVSVYDANQTPIRILGAYFEAYMPYQKPSLGTNSLQYDNDAAVTIQFFTLGDGGVAVANGTVGGGGGAGTTAPTETAVGSLKSWGPGGAKFFEGSNSLADTVIPLTHELKADESLIYKVTMAAGSKPRDPRQPGNDVKDGASTPVFDSLTVVYQLPQRKVLIKERVFD